MLLIILFLTIVTSTVTSFRTSLGAPRLRPTEADPSLRDYGNTEIWPLPASAINNGCGATLDPSTFKIITNQPSNDPYLEEISKRFLPQILYSFNGTRGSSTILNNITISVNDASIQQIQQDIDETYNLTFAKDCSFVTISANTIFGARHGLETFSQLVNSDRLTQVYSVQALDISDGPRFTFRGPLLDCARHWYAPNVLLNFFDALSYHKQNALIWGVGIDQSFVVESKAFPNISSSASFGPPGTHVYSREMVSFLVSEANFRGIRLIPYIEVVGHDPLNMPELLYCNGVKGSGLFHPLHSEVWSFFDIFWSDLREIFPEDYVQLGGDEVDLSCWSNDPEITQWNIAHGRSSGDLDGIYALYLTSMIASLKKVGFLPIWYAETYGPLSDKSVNFDFVGSKIIFDGWDSNTPSSLSDALTSGAKCIVTSYCFLMPMQVCPGFPECNGDQPNWWYNYGCELQNTTLFTPQALPYLKNILGGGPARWSEITDATNLFQFTYPAIMGAAEKLWSPALLTNGSYYGTRQEVFADHRCVLLRRGIPVQPTSAYSWDCPYEWEPVMPPRTPKNPNPNNSSWAPPSSSMLARAGLSNLTSDDERALRMKRTYRSLSKGNATVTNKGGSLGSLGEMDDYISLWPIPSSYTSVPCGGSPVPQWNTVCNNCTATSSDCPYLLHGDGRSLEACQASCLADDKCNAINYNPVINDCVFRSCMNKSPQTTPGTAYSVYVPLPPSFPVGIDPTQFEIILDTSVMNDPFMIEIKKRFYDIILWHPSGTFDRPIKLQTLTISVNDTSIRQIQSNVDESYTLGFNNSCTSAVAYAQTIFGARHALETFSQMIQAERLSGSYSIASYFGLFNISDTPRFDTRGLMVDSARHWLNPNVLLSLMDALSYVKMNKLEVGFGIDWSYTVESLAFPNLTDSSYGPKSTHMYSRDMIQFLVKEANYRGIRLVPYVELVGHNAVCGQLPDVCWCNGKPKGNLPHPLHAITWEFFDAFFADLKLIFPEQYINVGGDEVDTSCWVGDPEIEAWNIARGHGANETGYIAGAYYEQLVRSANKAGFKPIFYAEAWGSLNSTGFNDWQNVLYDGWDTQTPGSLSTLIQNGGQAIVSSYCFLAPTQGCPDNLPNGDTPDQWSNRACEIQDKSKFPAAAWPFLSNIHGGHPARWGEQTDGTNIYQFTWPALMGAAEVLWSPYTITSNTNISRSLAWKVTRCEMVRRGVPVDPRSGGGADCDFEYEPAYPPLTLLNPNRANSSWVVPM